MFYVCWYLKIKECTVSLTFHYSAVHTLTLLGFIIWSWFRITRERAADPCTRSNTAKHMDCICRNILSVRLWWWYIHITMLFLLQTRHVIDFNHLSRQTRCSWTTLKSCFKCWRGISETSGEACKQSVSYLCLGNHLELICDKFLKNVSHKICLLYGSIYHSWRLQNDWLFSVFCNSNFGWCNGGPKTTWLYYLGC